MPGSVATCTACLRTFSSMSRTSASVPKMSTGTRMPAPMGSSHSQAPR